MPQSISLAVTLAGPLSITALSVLTVARLRKQFPYEFPFRAGPLARY